MLMVLTVLQPPHILVHPAGPLTDSPTVIVMLVLVRVFLAV
jgi:hypothetical protein